MKKGKIKTCFRQYGLDHVKKIKDGDKIRLFLNNEDFIDGYFTELNPLDDNNIKEEQTNGLPDPDPDLSDFPFIKKEQAQ